MIDKIYAYKTEKVLPPGTYYIGDPCYTIDNRDTWLSYLNAWYADPEAFTNGDGNSRPAANMLNISVIHPFENNVDAACYIMSTGIGDGWWVDNDGVGYGVDAGVLGITPLPTPDCTEEYMRSKLQPGSGWYGGGQVIESDDSVVSTFDNGVWSIYYRKPGEEKLTTVTIKLHE